MSTDTSSNLMQMTLNTTPGLDAIKSLFARIATDPALPKEERPGRRRRRLSRDAAESDGEVDVEDSTLAEGVQESGTMEEFEGELREEISELEEQLGVRLLNANMKTISGNGLRGYKSAFKSIMSQEMLRSRQRERYRTPRDSPLMRG